MAEKEYIERGAAYPLAKKICDAINSDEFQRLNFGMRILDWIDDIPAADVRPVVRAKWEDVHIDRPEIADLEVASMFCPNCNRWYNKVYHYGNPIEFVNFCSFCGADMREVD